MSLMLNITYDQTTLGQLAAAGENATRNVFTLIHPRKQRDKGEAVCGGATRCPSLVDG